jgi:hypothetical protein
VDPPPEPRLPHNTATDWARTLYPLESPPIPYDCDSRKKLMDSNQNVVQSLCFTKHDVSIVNDSPKIGGIAKGRLLCWNYEIRSTRHTITQYPEFHEAGCSNWSRFVPSPPAPPTALLQRVMLLQFQNRKMLRIVHM